MLNENLIAELAGRGIVGETFRRLLPGKKSQIYRVAIDLLGEYGYDGLAVEKFCKAAGISKGSFFQYFESKSHLLEFTLLIFDDYLAAMVSEIRLVEPTALVRARLLYFYQVLIAESPLSRSERRFYLFVTRALTHSQIRIEGIVLERHFDEYLREIIERGEETGEIRRDYESSQTAELVSVLMGGLIRRQFTSGRGLSDGVEDYLISFLFDGVKA